MEVQENRPKWMVNKAGRAMLKPRSRTHHAESTTCSCTCSSVGLSAPLPCCWLPITSPILYHQYARVSTHRRMLHLRWTGRWEVADRRCGMCPDSSSSRYPPRSSSAWDCLEWEGKQTLTDDVENENVVERIVREGQYLHRQVYLTNVIKKPNWRERGREGLERMEWWKRTWWEAPSRRWWCLPAH